MLKYIAAIAFSFLTTFAYAGTGSINYTSAGSSPFRTTTDGSSNNIGQQTIWDSAAGANGLAITTNNAAKTEGVGAAGTPAGGVFSIQGVASGTAVPVSGSVSITGTVTVSGTVAFSNTTIAVTQATAASLNATVVGTVTANAGTNLNTSALATSANQTNATQKTQIVDGSGNVIGSTSNNLNVQCANCSGSGVSAQDAATFTAGTSLFAPTGGEFTTGGATACVTGHQCMAAITATRGIFTDVNTWAETSLGAPTAIGTAGTGNVIGTNSYLFASVSGTQTALTATANGLKVDGSAVTQPVSFSGNVTVVQPTAASLNATVTGTVTANLGTLNGAATAALQGTNSATTAHTCSVAGYSILGCLGQIDDDVKGSIAAGTAIIGKVGIDQTTPGTTNGVILTSQYPANSTPLTASATGTSAATTATLAGTSGKTTYLCSYSIRANATAATTVTNTITGVITGTLSHIMWVAPAASGIGVDEQIFNPCVPASGTNTGIAVVSGAPGTGGQVSSTATGYQL